MEMISPRKVDSSGAVEKREGMSSPRGTRLGSDQLTPRRRRQIEMGSGRGGLLPSRVTASEASVLATEKGRQRASPRQEFHEEEEEEGMNERSSKGKREPVNVPRYNRYGEMGSGDAFLRIPLEGMSKLDIKGELKHGTKPIPMGWELEKEDGQDEDEEEAENEKELEPDRARFNVWNGVNYDLHVLGKFKSEFERKVKSFQRPDTERLSLDPFCRSESGLTNEPSNSDAFLIWKSKSESKWPNLGERQTSLTSVFPVSSGDDEEDDDTDSLPDPDMKEYIQSQQQKREKGENVTGETFYYDEDFEMVRNLHRDSFSLTNYGVMPDEKLIGKADVFYPEMTESEKKMLRVPEKKKSALSSPRTPLSRRSYK